LLLRPSPLPFTSFGSINKPLFALSNGKLPPVAVFRLRGRTYPHLVPDLGSTPPMS